jgi:hypothetical protein
MEENKKMWLREVKREKKKKKKKRRSLSRKGMILAFEAH